MNSHTYSRRTRSGAAYAAVALACGLGLGACADDSLDAEPVEVEEVEEEAPQAEDIDEGLVEGDASEPTMNTLELLQNPDDYVGETVVVEAEIGEVFADKAFTIVPDEGNTAQGGDESLLVVGSSSGLEAGDVVVVGGTVNDGLDVTALAEEFGVDWADNEALEDFGGMEWFDLATVEPS